MVRKDYVLGFVDTLGSKLIMRIQPDPGIQTQGKNGREPFELPDRMECPSDYNPTSNMMPRTLMRFRIHFLPAMLAVFALLQTNTGTAQELTILDHMVLFTPEAATAAGGESGLRSLIDQAVLDTNQAFKNSEIHARTRLVHVGGVTDPEAGNTSADLGRLKSPDDGFYDSAHTLRTQHGADLVTLILEAPTSSGVGRANQLSSFSTPSDQIAFSVVLSRSLVGTYTMAHELGHNLGAHHTPNDRGSPGLFPHSSGFRFSAEGTTYRTIMARQFGSKIPFFSNPNVSFKGVPTGSPQDSEDPADNAATINHYALEAAQFRPEQFSNDSFSQAATLNGFWASGSGFNQTATAEADEPEHAEQAAKHSIWWKWVAPISDEIEISTTGTTFPHRMAIYGGTQIESLIPIGAASIDPSAENTPTKVNVSSGQTYMIAIDSLSDRRGFAAIQLRKNNDDFENAIHLNGTSHTSVALSGDATSEPLEPNHGFSGFPFGGGGKSVWWHWKAPGSGTVNISTQGTTYSTVLGVYQGSSVRELTTIAEENFTGSNGQWRSVTFEAIANQDYHIAIDSPGGLGSNSGMAILHIDLARSESISFTSITRPDNQTIALRIDGFLTTPFQLEATSDLSTWIPFETFQPDALPITLNVPIPSENGQQFFRITSQ